MTFKISRFLETLATRPFHSISGRFYSSNLKSQIDTARDVFIVGAGCIGQGLSASLLKSNPCNRIFLITKQKYIGDIQKSGISLKGVVEETFIQNNNFQVIDKVYDRLFN